jgi:nucleobase:cation symporter-1, NCS1 family
MLIIAKWKILASSQKFLAFLGGYTIFLGPMTAILMTDYYIVRKRNISVPDMYDFQGIYRYSAKYATNWRAVVALVLGFVPPLPGFIDNINSSTQTVKHHIITAGGQHVFAIGYIYSFIAAGVFYVVLMHFFPARESMMDHAVTGEDIISANDQRRVSLTPPMKKTLWNRIFAK